AGVAATAIAVYGLSGAPSIGPATRLSASIPGPVDAVAATARPQRPKPERRRERSDGPPQTSCDAVVHLGDSTSEGLVSPSYLPDPRRRIDSQYARVGVGRSRMEIEGATSIVELPPDNTNARDAAEEIAAGGYGGCWVIALGTNDGANAAIGSPVGVDERIDLMMSVIGERPALWLTARSLLGGGAYADEHMRAWNAALLRACDRYPNLRVFDWAAAVRDEWFIEDGIHYTSDGYAARAHRIAIALAEAFPAGGRSPDCVVG
ncbi:MAG: SGNH/GDSL hydrolase family protein, partial [Solirubrobacterales bacterium]